MTDLYRENRMPVSSAGPNRMKKKRKVVVIAFLLPCSSSGIEIPRDQVFGAGDQAVTCVSKIDSE